MSATKRTYLDLVDGVDEVDDALVHEMWWLMLPDENGNQKTRLSDKPTGCMTEEAVDVMFRQPSKSDDFTLHEESKCVFVNDTSNGMDIAGVVTRALQKVVNTAIETKGFPGILERHSEMYHILGTRYNAPVLVERFAVSIFGIAAPSVVFTAYECDESGSISIWAQRRGAEVLYPNMLDLTAAGGLLADKTPFEGMLDEAFEEASFSKELVKKYARSTGVVTHSRRHEGRPYFCVTYCYDMALPKGETPSVSSSEVAKFMLMNIKDLTDAMLRKEFRPGSDLSLIDFFIRHGIITAENETDYAELNVRLHRKLPVSI